MLTVICYVTKSTEKQKSVATFSCLLLIYLLQSIRCLKRRCKICISLCVCSRSLSRRNERQKGCDCAVWRHIWMTFNLSFQKVNLEIWEEVFSHLVIVFHKSFLASRMGVFTKCGVVALMMYIPLWAAANCCRKCFENLDWNVLNVDQILEKVIFSFHESLNNFVW